VRKSRKTAKCKKYNYHELLINFLPLLLGRKMNDFDLVKRSLVELLNEKRGLANVKREVTL